MPNKGDKVRVILEGEYSHQGGYKVLTGTGFHIIKVGGWEVAVPPATKIEVTQRWKPVEPLAGVVVRNRGTGHFWINDALFNKSWRCITYGGIGRLTWDELLAASDNGRSLDVYVRGPELRT